MSEDEHSFFLAAKSEIEGKWLDFHHKLGDWHMAGALGRPRDAEEPKIPAEREAEYANDMRRIKDLEFREEKRKQIEESERKFATYSGVPIRVREALGHLAETKATERVRKWIDERNSDNSKWCLVLSSDKGCGKSVAAGLFLKETRSMGTYVVNEKGTRKDLPAWWPISSFARLGGYDGKFDALCAHNGALVIDDLGSEYLDKNGWFSQALDAFIDARYSEYRPTLITTNLSAADFKSRYNERVADRIREGGCFFEFAGESLRGKQPKSEVFDWKQAAAGE